MGSGPRPLQNRVTPFGDVVSIAQRGLFIGNRGIIHDPATKTLLGTRWTTKAWLVCVLDYKGRHREVMGGRSWTQLFFLEAPLQNRVGLANRGNHGAVRQLGDRSRYGMDPFAAAANRSWCSTASISGARGAFPPFALPQAMRNASAAAAAQEARAMPGGERHRFVGMRQSPPRTRQWEPRRKAVLQAKSRSDESGARPDMSAS
jgi:hypothetical protein